MGQKNEVLMARILMMEGNTLAKQKKGAAIGVESASQVYSKSILAHFPDAKIDVIHAADRGQSLPAGKSMSDYDGLVVGGSGLHAYDDRFEVTNQIDLLRTFSETGKPILGSCWGLQIAAIAGGGSVGKSPNGREVGVARKIWLTEAGQSHPFLKTRPLVYDAPCIHYDEVTALPSGSVLLCSNAHSEVQGATVPVGESEVWAVQYHPEFDIPLLSGLYKLYADDMIGQGFFTDAETAAHYKADFDLLAKEPGNKSLRWRLGIDDDILIDAVRRTEIINWVNMVRAS